MTREETQELLATVSVYFTNFRPENKTATINAWYRFTEYYSKNALYMALDEYTLSGAEFAPTIGQLINIIADKATETEYMDAAEAWQVVRRAIGRGNYHAQEDFDAFSPEIKRAIGNDAEFLKIAARNTDFNEGVESSNFYKKYNQVVQQAKEEAKKQALPAVYRQRVAQVKQAYLEARQ